METENSDSDFFEVILSQHVSQKIQKMLPQGYSLQLVKKTGKKVPKKIEIDKKKKKKVQGVSNGFNKIKIMKIIKLLKDHKLIGPFLHPVDPEKLNIPNYYEIIKEPMDLKTVEENLKKDSYVDEEEIKDDLEKIWNNARMYNPEGTDINEMAKEMKTYCNSLFEKKEFERLDFDIQQLAEDIKKLSNNELLELKELKELRDTDLAKQLDDEKIVLELFHITKEQFGIIVKFIKEKQRVQQIQQLKQETNKIEQREGKNHDVEQKQINKESESSFISGLSDQIIFIREQFKNQQMLNLNQVKCQPIHPPQILMNRSLSPLHSPHCLLHFLLFQFFLLFKVLVSKAFLHLIHPHQNYLA